MTVRPQANTFAVAARLLSSDKLHAMCKNGYRGFLDTFSTHISLHLKPADNMDGASSLNAVEVSDVLAFQGPAVVPGRLDDRVPFLISEGVVCSHSEAGEACVTNVCESDVADDTEDFNSVDLFDAIHGQYSLRLFHLTY